MARLTPKPFFEYSIDSVFAGSSRQVFGKAVVRVRA